MNEDFAKRVGSAAVAGWWMLLIVAVFLTLQWVAYMVIMHNKPACVLALWGGDIEWTTVQTIWLWMVAVFKLCVWIAAMVVVWLTLWARRLRRT
jgi:hypothetical protein